MKTNLKVGDTFEVVEVLTDGGYGNVFKVGGHTIGHKDERGVYCLSNSEDFSIPLYMSYILKQIKPVGRLVVKKVK